jgi:hypothetical protein
MITGMTAGLLGAFVTCTIAQNSAAPSGTKAPAAGIFYLLEGDRVDRPVHGVEKRRVWANDNISGVTFRTFWNKVERGDGQFDWSHFDDGIALARKFKKAVSLSVGAGVNTPDWVYEAGAKKFNFMLKTNYKGDNETFMPPQWDEVFLKKWNGFVSAMGQKYDGDPTVAYVTMGGLGWAVETHFVKTKEDLERFRAEGGVRKWTDAGKKIVDMYGAAFPHTPFILAVAEIVPGQEGKDALREVVEYGSSKYPGRFGVMQHGLNAVSNPDFYPNKLVQSLSDRTPVGFQMVWSTKDKNGKLVKGTLADALQRATEMKAHFVEVYAADCDEPEYGALLQRMDKELKKNHPARSAS